MHEIKKGHGEEPCPFFVLSAMMILRMLKMLCAMEDDNRLRIRKYQGKPMIAFQNTDKSDEGLLVQALMQKWAEKAEMLQRGEITQEEYDQWRWNDIE